MCLHESVCLFYRYVSITAVVRFSPVLNDRIAERVYTVYTVHSEGPHSSIGGTRLGVPPDASSIDARETRVVVVVAPTRRVDDVEG
jgi:hypothetical protein